MRTVIVGCGRGGSSLARQLSAEGDDVAVVDFSESAFNRLGEDFAGEMIFGSAVDEDILRRDVGSMGITDFLFVVLLGDAAQNGMIGGATSSTFQPGCGLSHSTIASFQMRWMPALIRSFIRS